MGYPSQKEKLLFWWWYRFTKYEHFIAISHPHLATFVAQVFLDQIFKLRGMPENIISDLDSVFISKFWHELFS